MPELGDGILGRHLLAQSVRLGPGEFHSLREYVPGDEPRTIHWRASARSDELKVRQHSAEGLRRCTVVLDQQVPTGDRHADAFERAVVAAASLVHSADQAGLETRFATTAGVDLRGPTVAVHTMHHLAQGDARPASAAADRARPGRRTRARVRRHAKARRRDAFFTLGEMRDPSLTLLGVFTEEAGVDGRFAAPAVRRRHVRVGAPRQLGEARGSRQASELPQGQPAVGPPGGRRPHQRDDRTLRMRIGAPC